MIVITRQLMSVDLDMEPDALIANWTNGNRNSVIEALSKDHAGLAAAVLAHGVMYKTLTQQDIADISKHLWTARNELANTD